VLFRRCESSGFSPESPHFSPIILPDFHVFRSSSEKCRIFGTNWTFSGDFRVFRHFWKSSFRRNYVLFSNSLSNYFRGFLGFWGELGENEKLILRLKLRVMWEWNWYKVFEKQIVWQ
jgi:hypothetical protein